MSLLTDITWPQLILIEIGALMQFVALCEFVREKKHDHLPRETRQKVRDTRAQVQKLAEQEILLRAIHAGPISTPHPETHDDPAQEHAANLVKTARVKFHQKFKFREQE